LRGAGDTRFVTLVMFFLAWPIMVIPTHLVVTAGGSVYWAWWFATAYTFAMAVCFTLRFRSGKWKAMRVIEAPPTEQGGDSDCPYTGSSPRTRSRSRGHAELGSSVGPTLPPRWRGR